MEFVSSDSPDSPLLSREQFVALDDEAKLWYFAQTLPVFEKKILTTMISSCVKDSSVSGGTSSGNVEDRDKAESVSDMDVLACTASCHGESDFDVTKFQFSIAKLVVKKATALANAIWTDLFASLSTERAKIMVKSGIAKMHEANPDLNVASTSLTYGEVDFYSFANILEKANPKLGETFVDLGHGTGKGSDANR
jgi:hypothetical protein